MVPLTDFIDAYDTMRSKRRLTVAHVRLKFRSRSRLPLSGELGMIMGPALLEYEADQAAWNEKVAQEKKNRGLRSPSVVPLRGYCLIGYYTMMRPDCNLHLRWDEVTLDAGNLTGWYKLDQHKNVNKGIKAEGPLAEELVEYLLSVRPAHPGNAPIHFNPETGLPYVDIRKQWERLMVIASRMLRYDLENKKRTFFNFQHTGVSHIAARQDAGSLARRRADDG